MDVAFSSRPPYKMASILKPLVRSDRELAGVQLIRSENALPRTRTINYNRSSIPAAKNALCISATFQCFIGAQIRVRSGARPSNRRLTLAGMPDLGS
jgi:hypothetical protein